MSRGRNAATALKDAAPVFAALGETTRLRLVARLCHEGPLSIARLSEGAGVTRQAVTKHLHTLAEAGLVHGTRSGRERIWQLEPKRLENARRCLDQISTQWDAAIDRLRAFVEGKP
ncbi:MAG: helix-turn-helix transcriptional regulator [Acidobacteria bacterium]|nr:helix-turn-helix transcriptional regulator [Acidobacteriota bacterium]